MKRLSLFIISAIVLAMQGYSQQLPLSENYFSDKYSLAPSYAGNFNSKYLFMGYRSDWSGIDGGPKTVRLTFNDALPFMENAGYGGKLIYDKAGIFGQTMLMGSYSYDLKVSGEHNIMFGLSAGFFRNRLNLLDYYNDPKYTVDPSLIGQDINSKLKFVSDFSVVWKWKGAEAGVMFSNLNFGDASYKELDLKYNPLANYQFHATYLYSLNEDWDIAPLVLLRSGKYIRSQVEVSGQVMYLKRFWGSVVFRDPGILGCGIGAKVTKGLIVSYNFNFATNVTMGAFNNHEISVGVNIFDYIGTTK